MAAATWQPQEEGLREICRLLEQQISPNSDQARIWQQLQHYSQFPDFNNYLAFILSRPEAGNSTEIRQAAGLLLKNNLRIAFNSLSPVNQQYIKSQLLPCLGAANKSIRSTVGTVISVVVQLGKIHGWPELLQALVQCLDSNDSNHMEGAMDAIYKICEDIPEELDLDVPGLAERPINIFMPRLLQFFQSPHAILRKLSLGSINQFIVMMPTALLLSMDKYLQGLFVLARDQASEVRKLVPVFVTEIASKHLRGGLTALNQLMICTGMTVTFIFGTFLTWRTLVLIGVLPCLVLFVGLIFIPETPRWLAIAGYDKEFETALKILNGRNADITEEAEEIHVFNSLNIDESTKYFMLCYKIQKLEFDIKWPILYCAGKH